MLFLSLVPCSVNVVGQGRGWTRVRNGVLWYTDRGDTVQAHAPGFLRHEGRWWMVGEDRDNGGLPDVNLYSSYDFRTWHYEGKIITLPDEEGLPVRMIERAKIMYCKRTGHFVIWCHWEAPNYSASEAASFEAEKITGPYRCTFRGRPLGVKTRDCNVFVDDDGTAYFVATTNENQDIGLFLLSDDYTQPVKHYPLFVGQRREAPVIVRVGDIYHVLTSACTGWAPNQCQHAWSESLTHGWSALHNVGDNTCFRTQPAAIIRAGSSKKSGSLLYVGDRWKDPTLAESKTILFPIQFTDTTCQIINLDSFDINWREKVCRRRAWR